MSKGNKTTTAKGKKVNNNASSITDAAIIADQSPQERQPLEQLDLIQEVFQEPGLVNTIHEVSGGALNMTVNDNGQLEEPATIVYNDGVMIRTDNPDTVRDLLDDMEDDQTGVNLISGVEVIDPEDILNSKRYLKGAIEYPAPSELLRPAIEALGRTGGRMTLTGSHEAANRNTDGTTNTAYGRLNLICRYEIDNEMWYEVGVLVAYDMNVPRVKVYRGMKVSACLNLCIWGAEDMVKFDLSAGMNLEIIGQYITSVTAQIERSREIVQRLKGIEIQQNLMGQIIGKMLLHTIEQKAANGTTPILKAADMFSDSKSKYYYKQEGFNAWQLYNGFTEYFAEKVNFFDIPEKTRDTYKLLHDICLS
jgi:hypothetical protein